MTICVHGLWHLGSVTAACLASAGFKTVGIDDDATVVAGLSKAVPPISEPGLPELVSAGLTSGRLSFSSDVAAVAEANIVWVTFDTPVDDQDRADTAFVENRIQSLFVFLKNDAVVLVSSQLPVGSVRRISELFRQQHPDKQVGFACSPENLRLGQAIHVFNHPERIIIGTEGTRERDVLEPLLGKFCQQLIWMSLESAEMVKHGVNSFLAMSITFANEMATLCERTGADATEVERGLRSEPRIGAKAYIRPGPAFAGGTLARDVSFLRALASRHDMAVPLLSSIIPSNAEHRNWALRRLTDHFADLNDRTVAVLGLTYKPGTDTLRRSAAVELCEALAARHCRLVAFDPAVKVLPAELATKVSLRPSMDDALSQADAVVIATEWPEFRDLSPTQCAARMRHAVVIDQSRFLSSDFTTDTRVTYMTIGRPT